MNEACKLVHPSKELDESFKIMMVMGSLEVRKCRLSAANKILRLAAETGREEEQLHHAWPEHLRRILKNKKLILFKRLLNGLGYEDAKIAEEMMVGFILNGLVPESTALRR